MPYTMCYLPFAISHTPFAICHFPLPSATLKLMKKLAGFLFVFLLGVLFLARQLKNVYAGCSPRQRCTFVVVLLLLAALVIPMDSFAQVPPNSWECVMVGPGGLCRPNTSTATCTGDNIIPANADTYCAEFNGPAKAAQCNSAGGGCVAPPAGPGEPFRPDECDCDPDWRPDFCADNPPIRTALGCIPTHPLLLIGQFRNILVGVGGGIAFLLLIIGAFFVLTSQGDPERVKRGKEIFVGALVGLLIMIFSIFILQLTFTDILDMFK